MDELHLEPKEQFKIYAYENSAADIFHHEKEKALKDGRSSRLHPFLFTPGLGLGGPHFRNSHSCKSQAVKALEDTLTVDQIKGLTENGKHPTVPHYSGDVEQMFLYSTGPLSIHRKSSGAKIVFREAIGSKPADSEEPVRVFWSAPPQIQPCDALHPNTVTLLSIPYADEVKQVVSRLQRVEWKIRNATLPSANEEAREKLLHDIVATYQIFSIIKGCESLSTASLYTRALSFFRIPQTETEAEKRIQIIKAAKCLQVIHHELNHGDLPWQESDRNEINEILEPSYWGQLCTWGRTGAISMLGR